MRASDSSSTGGTIAASRLMVATAGSIVSAEFCDKGWARPSSVPLMRSQSSSTRSSSIVWRWHESQNPSGCSSVDAAMDVSSIDQRRVIELRLSGLKGAEIASVIGCAHSAVKMLRHRAMNRLRAGLVRRCGACVVRELGHRRRSDRRRTGRILFLASVRSGGRSRPRCDGRW